MRKEKCEIPGPPLRKAKVGSLATLVVCGPGPRRAEEVVKVEKVEGREIYVEGLGLAFSRDTGVAKTTLKKGMLVMLDDELVSL
jgi:hypothetical protein